MTLFTIFITSLMIAFSGAVMPGPLLTITISESSSRGIMTGPLLIAGHGILELLLVIALILGLGPVLKMEPVFIFIAIAGSIVLLWMGIGMIKALPTLSLTKDKTRERQRNLIFSGALLSLANPYWSIWWATIGLGYILKSMDMGKMGVMAFITGHLLGDLIWYTFISTAMFKGSRLLGDRAYRMLIGGCAIFLIVFSVLFAWSGVSKLMA